MPSARHLALCVAFALSLSLPAKAAFVYWTVDSAASQLSIDVAASSLYAGSLTTGSQVPGTAFGLSTSVIGNFGSTPITPTSTSLFLAGGLGAQNSFAWGPLPGGSPGLSGANFGVLMDHLTGPDVTGSIFAAFRNLVISFPGVTMTGGAGDFNGPPNFSFASGAMDYFSTGDLSFYGLGSLPMADFNPSTGLGLQMHIDFNDPITPTAATMTLDFNFTFTESISGSVGQFSYPLLLFTEFTGHIVATSVVPEAHSFFLSLMGLSAFAGVSIRYRKQKRPK
jgi:hypothetical protein